MFWLRLIETLVILTVGIFLIAFLEDTFVSAPRRRALKRSNDIYSRHVTLSDGRQIHHQWYDIRTLCSRARRIFIDTTALPTDLLIRPIVGPMQQQRLLLLKQEEEQKAAAAEKTEAAAKQRAAEDGEMDVSVEEEAAAAVAAGTDKKRPHEENANIPPAKRRKTKAKPVHTDIRTFFSKKK